MTTKTPPDYMDVLNFTGSAITEGLRQIRDRLMEEFPGSEISMNAGPILQGAIGAVVQFAMFDTEGSEDAIRQQIIDTVDEAIPQVRFAKEALRAGASPADVSDGSRGMEPTRQ